MSDNETWYKIVNKLYFNPNTNNLLSLQKIDDKIKNFSANNYNFQNGNRSFLNKVLDFYE